MIVYTIHPVKWKGAETKEVDCYSAHFNQRENGYVCADNDDIRYALNKLFIPKENIVAIEH